MATKFNLTAELNAQINKGSVQSAVRQLKTEIAKMSTTVSIKFDRKATRHVREMTNDLKKMDKVGAHLSRSSAALTDDFARMGRSSKSAGKNIKQLHD